MSIKAVIFDLDDTLYGDFKTCNRLGLEACAAYAEAHCGVSSDVFLNAVLESKKALQERLFEEPEMHDRVLYMQGALEKLGIPAIRHSEILHDIYWNALYENMYLREGVHELLDELHVRGIKVICCTNMLAAVQMRKLCLLDLAERIDYLVSSEEAGIDKPQAPIFELALVKAGCSANEAIMVGDNFNHDIWGASQAGIPGLWLHVHKEAQPTADIPYLEAPDFQTAAKMILEECERKK